MSIITTLQQLSSDLDAIDLEIIADKVLKLEQTVSDVNVLYDEVAKVCADKTISHPEWALLSGRLMVTKLKMDTPSTFIEAMTRAEPLLHTDFMNFVKANAEFLNSMIEPKRDMDFNAFSMGTLLKSYLMRFREGDKVTFLETPQYMYLRIACYIWYPNLEKIKEMYDDLSTFKYTQATPTMFNAGRKKSQLASCFLMSVGDNMGEISKSWHDSALISMTCGGIGMDYSALRHSEIGMTGISKGIVPWLKIQNEILCGMDQTGIRKGSGTINLCDWHIDIENFIEMRKPFGDEKMRARDLFYSLFISDLFMERVQKDENWSLFCPNKARGMTEVWGAEFEELYLRYEREGRMKKVVRARELWEKIIVSQIETGMPFILYKDSINRKCNQSNIGIIKTSNLCQEITEVTNQKEIASCNLASVALCDGVRNREYDFDILAESTKRCVYNLNQVIDRNFYHEGIPEIKFANLKNRPIGIGVQGLADTFAMMNYWWDSDKAKELNYQIFEQMYYSALDASCELAEKDGYYDSYVGSPVSRGKLQFDMWKLEDLERGRDERKSYSRISEEKWGELRKRINRFGVRNSLLIALMPTASSASIMGNNECFEPFTSNIYSRTVLSGQYTMVNKHLIRDLEALGLWNTEVARNIVKHKGSVQYLDEVLDNIHYGVKVIQKKYMTVFEMKQKVLLDMSIDRGRFVCQSQSFNCWMADPNFKKLNAYHFHAWKEGQKTGMYYLRQPPRVDATNYSIDTVKVSKRRNEPEECLMCSG